jgi:hypothetical protein
MRVVCFLIACNAMAAPNIKWAEIPLSFEPNRGQAPDEALYVARTGSYTLYLTGASAVLASRNGRPLRTTFLGADPAARIQAEAQQISTSNYFIGNDPSRWRTSVPNFARARFAAIYPGIDLVYYGNQGRVEYDWLVSPGADPLIIGVKFEGHDRLRIDRRGDLVIKLGEHEYRHGRPFAYQEIDGKRIEIACRWALQGKKAGFRLGAYDRTRQLVIDPPLIYSTYLGGNGLDFANALAIDSSGNTYITGGAQSANFPTTNPYQNSLRGAEDAFVVKISANGTDKIFSTYLGGGGPDEGKGIAVDSQGYVYVTGSAGSLDFPTVAAVQPAWGGSGDAFLTKLNAAGSGLEYSTYLGGGAIDYGTAVTVDPSGNAYVVGVTFSTNFPTVHPFQAAKGAQQDAFVAKINPRGTAWTYSTYLGGNNVDEGYAIAADAAGNAYVTGYTASTNFPLQAPLFGSVNTSSVAPDAFVTKLNATGSALVFSTYLGGSATDYGTAIAVDSSGYAYVAGITTSSDFPAVNAMQPHIANGPGVDDAFVTKFNPAGSALVYSTYLGGGSGDEAFALAIDQAGNAYVTGRTNSSDFPLTNAIQATRFAFDMFVTELNASGSARLFSTFLGGTGDDSGRGIAIDSRGNIHVAGQSNSTDFPVMNAVQGVYGGAQDAAVMLIGNSPWPGPGPALAFFPIRPCRAVDTRTSQAKTGAFGPPEMAAYVGRDFPLTQSGCGIPSSAQAYSLNLTVVPPGPLSFLSVWPNNQPFPGVSTLNSTDGSVTANAAIVPAGTNGNITVTTGDPTDLIIDTNGYFAPPSANGLAFYPVTPCRIADTRASQGFSGAFGPPGLVPYSGRNFPILSTACNIPAAAKAYSLNLTAVPSGELDFISIWPSDQPYPGVSTLNSLDGSIVANAAIVPAAANGNVTVVAGNATDFIMDINGYFAPPGNPGALQFYAAPPCRLADTRAFANFPDPFGPPALSPYTGRTLLVRASRCGIPSAAKAYSLNITVVPPGPLSFLAAWPSDKPFPGVSTLNSPKGTTLANAAIVPASAANGSILVTAGNATDLIIDINGFFAP